MRFVEIHVRNLNEINATVEIQKVEPLSAITLNASSSCNTLYFIYARKAMQIQMPYHRKIYVTVESTLR